MKSGFRKSLVCLWLSLSLLACKRDSDMLSPAAVLQTGLDVRINDLICLNDSVWIAAGGVRDEIGYFLKTQDAGKHWAIQSAEFPRSVYNLYLANDSVIWAGGDFLFLWKSYDFGETWIFHWLGDQVPFNEEDRPAIRDMAELNDSVLVFVGGENLGEGVIYESHDEGDRWDFTFRQHEYRTIVNLPDEVVFIGGHGESLVMKDSLEAIVPLSLKDEFIVASCNSGEALIILTMDGDLYRVGHQEELSGVQWKDRGTALSGRKNWSAMTSIGEKILAVGFDGALLFSADGGRNWEEKSLEGKPDLLHVTSSGNTFVAASTHGSIYMINL